MDSLTDNLFLSVSNSIGLRVTPENLRVQMAAADSTGKIGNKVKTEILIELLLAFSKLEEKVDATRTETR